MKIAVAMSGGVDSSVAAALMCEKYGKENVFGVTARLFCYGEGSKSEKACCSLQAIDDAKSICIKLGIPHYVINEEPEFEEAVIKNFIEAYRHGQTPIPCIPCNSVIKFGSMLEKVKKIGAEKLVTGHYARIMSEAPKDKSQKTNNSQVSNYQLLKGLDATKDQTYFLHGLDQDQLAQTEFPIGELTKKEVRGLAKKLGLKTAEKKESQGVCFVIEGRVTDYLADKIKSVPGNIINTKGEVVGAHEGYIFYTIGQRKRIGGGYKEPMFVVGTDPINNEVTIGNSDDLYKKELSLSSIHWINEPNLPLRCTAKIRYNMDDTPCVVNYQELNPKKNRNSKFENQNFVVSFSEPQRAITPGQSVVFYDGEACLGGGIIS